MKKLHDRIKTIRLNLGLNQEDFAKAVGFESKSAVSKLEKGNLEPSISKLATIAKLGNVSIDWLITGDDYLGSYKLSEEIAKLQKENIALKDIIEEIMMQIKKYKKL